MWRIKQLREELKATKGKKFLQRKAELVEARRPLPICVRYETETARLSKEGDWQRTFEATWAEIDSLAQHIAAIMEEPDWTAEGLLIKAEALSSWGRATKDSIFGGSSVGYAESGKWHRKIAESILRHVCGGAA